MSSSFTHGERVVDQDEWTEGFVEIDSDRWVSGGWSRTFEPGWFRGRATVVAPRLR